MMIRNIKLKNCACIYYLKINKFNVKDFLLREKLIFLIIFSNNFVLYFILYIYLCSTNKKYEENKKIFDYRIIFNDNDLVFTEDLIQIRM